MEVVHPRAGVHADAAHVQFVEATDTSLTAVSAGAVRLPSQPEAPWILPRSPEASSFVDPARGVADAAAALEGARWILMEALAEDAEIDTPHRDTSSDSDFR